MFLEKTCQFSDLPKGVVVHHPTLGNSGSGGVILCRRYSSSKPMAFWELHVMHWINDANKRLVEL